MIEGQNKILVSNLTTAVCGLRLIHKEWGTLLCFKKLALGVSFDGRQLYLGVSTLIKLNEHSAALDTNYLK